MTAKWMRIEKVTLLDGIFAVIVAALLCLLLFEDQLPIPAFGADNSKSNLVPYFVTWHVTARGSHQRQSLNQVETWRTTSEMRGSAITRFVDRGRGILSYWDTRFLTVEARKNTDYWKTLHFDRGDCFSHNSHTIADTGSYSGYYNDQKRNGDAPSVLDGSVERRNGVITNFSLPFSTWRGMKFTEHFVNEEQGTVTNCNGANSWDQSNGFPAIFPAPQDLPADRDNPNSYSLNTRASGFDTQGIPIDVHWTAHAYLMGKCAERDGPIQEGDPVIQDEDVGIDTDDSDIAPDGKTKVHIRVTCEGVPVEGAKVKIEVEPVDSSGGHIHVNNRPKGKLDGKDLTAADPSITRTTDKDGKVKGSDGITFAPPGKAPISRCLGLSGDYKVTATSEKFKDRKDSTMIVVRLKENLTTLRQSQNYDICADSVHGCDKEGPWGTTDHPDSEYGTAGTIQAFQGVATDFWNQEQSHNQLLQACGKKRWPMKKVSFNDIALPWGGLFDMNSTWTQPHKTHGKGQGGDFNHFKGNTCEGPCLSCGGATVNFDAFLWNLLKYTAQPKYGHWDGEVNSTGELHLHVEDQGQGPPSSCPADN